MSDCQFLRQLTGDIFFFFFFCWVLGNKSVTISVGVTGICFNWFFFLWQKLYKENYEKTKAKSINYCETPKFQLDTVLHNFTSDVSSPVVITSVKKRSIISPNKYMKCVLSFRLNTKIPTWRIFWDIMSAALRIHTIRTAWKFQLKTVM